MHLQDGVLIVYGTRRSVSILSPWVKLSIQAQLRGVGSLSSNVIAWVINILVQSTSLSLG